MICSATPTTSYLLDWLSLYAGGLGWLVSHLHALISFATRCADSIAPCIHPFHRDVCSPAKEIRPSLRALTGIQFSSPGPNDVRPPRCHGSSLQLFTRAASNCSRAPGNTISASAEISCPLESTAAPGSRVASQPTTLRPQTDSWPPKTAAPTQHNHPEPSHDHRHVP